MPEIKLQFDKNGNTEKNIIPYVDDLDRANNAITNLSQEKIVSQIKIAALSAQVEILERIIQNGLKND